MSTRSLGNMIVRLGVELAKYKADWREAVDTTKDGASKIDQEAGKAAGSVDKLTNAASKLPGELGNTARQATQMVGALQAGTGASLALAGGLAAVVAGVGVLGYAAAQGAAENRKLNDQLTLTGNFAGLVTGQLDRMATSVANSIGGKVSASREVLASLVSTGKFTVDSLNEVATAVQLVARFSGQTNAEVTKHFIGMADGAAKWAAKENEAYHFLDSAQLQHIKRMEEQGDKQGAMRVGSEALSRHLGGDLTANLGIVESAWVKLGNAASKAWSNMMNAGKPAGLDELLEDSTRRLEQARSGLAARSAGGSARAESEEVLNRTLFRRREIVMGNAAAQSELAQATEKAAKADEAWEKIVKGNQTALEKMNAELDRARKTFAGKTGAGDAAELEEQLRRIRASYEKHSGQGKSDPYDALIKSAKERVAVLELEAAATGKVTDAEKLLAKYESDLAEGTITFNAVKDQAYRLTLSQMEADEKAAVMKDRVTKANIEAGKAHEANIKALSDGVDKQQAELDKLLEHNAALGLSKTATAELTATKLEDQAVTLEGIAIKKLDRDLDYEMYELRKKEIDLLRQRAAAIRNGAAKEEYIDGAKKAAEEWKRTTDAIENNLTDALMRGFENGKDAAANFRDVVINMFKTMVLRPIVQGLVQGGMNAIGMGPQGGGAAGYLGAAGNAYSAYTNAGSLGQIGYQWATGSMSAGNAAGSLYANAAGTGIDGLLATNGAYGTAGGAGAGAGAGGAMGGMGALGLAGLIAAVTAWDWGQSKKAGLPGYTAILAPGVGPTTRLAQRLGLIAEPGGPKTEMGYGFGTDGINGRSWSDDGARQLTQGIEAGFAQLASTLGISARVNAGVFIGRDPEGKSKSQVRVIGGMDGRTVYDRANEGSIENVGREDGDVQAAVAEATTRLYFNALQESDLPDKLKELLNKVADSAPVAEMVAAIEHVTAARQEQLSLEEQLYQLTATDEEKLARTRKEQRAAVDPVNAALLEEVIAHQDLAVAAQRAAADAEALARTQERIANEREGLERRLMALQGDTAGLRALDLAALDASNRARQQEIWAIEDQAAAMEDHRREADAAMSALERAVNARRTEAEAAAQGAQQLVASLQSVFDTLKGSVRDLYGETDGSRALAAAQGQAFIATALAKARAGGSLPDAGDLQDAIGAARGGFNAGGRQADRDFERLALAGQLKELERVAGPQLTAAEQAAAAAQDQVDYLDKLLEQARNNLDAVNGVDTSVLSVEEAIQRLYDAFLKVNPAAKLTPIGGTVPAAAAAAAAGSGGPNFAGIQGGGSAAPVMTDADMHPGFAYAGGTAPEWWANAHGTWNDPRGNNWTGPSFARGGDHAGGWMKAGEHGEELIYSPPARIFNATDTDRILNGGGGNADMTAELRQLRAAFGELARELAAVKDSSRDAARYLKGMTRGGSSSILTEAA